jgi:hypothetical protein
MLESIRVNFHDGTSRENYMWFYASLVYFSLIFGANQQQKHGQTCSLLHILYLQWCLPSVSTNSIVSMVTRHWVQKCSTVNNWIMYVRSPCLKYYRNICLKRQTKIPKTSITYLNSGPRYECRTFQILLLIIFGRSLVQIVAQRLAILTVNKLQTKVFMLGLIAISKTN